MDSAYSRSWAQYTTTRSSEDPHPRTPKETKQRKTNRRSRLAKCQAQKEEADGIGGEGAKSLHANHWRFYRAGHFHVDDIVTQQDDCVRERRPAEWLGKGRRQRRNWYQSLRGQLTWRLASRRRDPEVQPAGRCHGSVRIEVE